MASIQDFNVFVGAETGLLKGVNINKHSVIAKNLNSLQTLDRQQEVTCMAWGGPEEAEVLMGLRGQKVKVYDTEFKGFTDCVDTPFGTGPLRGVGKINGSIVTASENGDVKLWKFQKNEQIEIAALNGGENLARMRVSPYANNILGTGGKKNDLQIWDIERPDEPIFRAKNEKHDFLDLPIPIWISDFAFVPHSEQVVSCSRRGHVRLYDPKSSARRPVVSLIPEKEEAWTAISIAPGSNHILLGSGKGRMLLVDLRMQKSIHAYRGFTGAIRELACHPVKPYVVSVGIDRFVRVHHLEKQTPIFKTYLKSRLNAVLMRQDFDIETTETDEVQDIWSEMEVIQERSKKSKDSESSKSKGNAKKMRKKAS